MKLKNIIKEVYSIMCDFSDQDIHRFANPYVVAKNIKEIFNPTKDNIKDIATNVISNYNDWEWYKLLDNVHTSVYHHRHKKNFYFVFFDNNTDDECLTLIHNEKKIQLKYNTPQIGFILFSEAYENKLFFDICNEYTLQITFKNDDVILLKNKNFINLDI